MKRRHFFDITIGIGVWLVLDWFQSRPALAGLFDFLNHDAGAPNPTPNISTQSYEIVATYENPTYLSRNQIADLEGFNGYHWSNIGQPYGRLASEDGLEHYYYPFDFGDGGLVAIADSGGIVSSVEITGRSLAPAFLPADMGEYVYYPPKSEPDYPPPPPVEGSCY
jgi:hypothetical protein